MVVETTTQALEGIQDHKNALCGPGDERTSSKRREGIRGERYAIAARSDGHMKMFPRGDRYRSGLKDGLDMSWVPVVDNIYSFS